jgi:hypothetical protein
MYDPLYSPNVGLGGFRCRECARVTRTERGVKAHCWLVHGKKVQLYFTWTNELVPASDRGGASVNSKEGGSRTNDGDEGSSPRNTVPKV